MFRVLAFLILVTLCYAQITEDFETCSQLEQILMWLERLSPFYDLSRKVLSQQYAQMCTA
jgi:hypothetical protein